MFDNDYNKNLSSKYLNNMRNKINEDQPDNISQSVGGSSDRMIGGGSVYRSNKLESYYKNVNSNDKYIQPGTVSGYPQFNMIELRELDSKPVIKVEPLQGGRAAKMDGGFSFNDFLSGLKNVTSSALDIGAPILGESLGGPIGATVATAARGLLKKTTGYGRATKPRKVAGVGILSKIKRVSKKVTNATTSTAASPSLSPASPLDNIIKGGKRGRRPKNTATSAATSAATSTSTTTKSKGNGKMKSRFELVKKIMNEKKLSLPAASKYIKDNNLSY
jgi:hypothetical protein